MKFWKYLLAVSLGLICLSACKPDAPNDADTTHNSQNALDWQGTYRGTLPCADCSGIETVITLNTDNSYYKQARYLGKGDEKPFTEQGSFQWSENGNSITLGKGNETTQYQVGENILFMLDQQGKPISGKLAQHYQLTKQSDPTLTETYWKLTEIMGKPVPKSAREAHIILKEKDNRVIGSGGCNRLNGGYTLKEPNRISFSGAAMTMMACLEGMDTDRLLADILEKADSYTLANGKLQLNRARMAPLAVFEPVYLY